MSELNCHYHPNREASDKCEMCNRLICLECKMVFHGSYGSNHKTYCPVCYERKNEIIRTHSRTATMYFLVALFIFLILFLLVYFMVF